MPDKSKRLPWILAGIVVVLLIVVIGLPLLVNASTLRPILESKLSAALGRPVKVDNLKLAIFSGGVAAEGFSIADDPAFSHDPFVQAKSVKVSVSLMPLLFSQRLDVEGVTIEEPQIVLIQTPAAFLQRWMDRYVTWMTSFSRH